MKWYEPTAEKLAFDKVYTRATIIDLLRQDYPYVSFNSYAWAVNSLVEEGKITRIGRNQYVRASEHDKSAFHPVYSAAMNELIRDIDNAFADCRFVVFESGLLEQIGFSVSRHQIGRAHV